jgi:hypothetical protein
MKDTVHIVSHLYPSEAAMRCRFFLRTPVGSKRVKGCPKAISEKGAFKCRLAGRGAPWLQIFGFSVQLVGDLENFLRRIVRCKTGGNARQIG